MSHIGFRNFSSIYTFYRLLNLFKSWCLNLWNRGQHLIYALCKRRSNYLAMMFKKSWCQKQSASPRRSVYFLYIWWKKISQPRVHLDVNISCYRAPLPPHQKHTNPYLLSYSDVFSTAFIIECRNAGLHIDTVDFLPRLGELSSL